MKRTENISEKQLAQRVAASEKSIAVRTENARIRKISAVKQNEKTNQILMRHADTLARHAIIPAIGASYIYKIDKITKKNTQVRDPDEIAHALDILQGRVPLDESSHEYYYTTADKPDIKAIEIIWNKMFGKAIEKKEVEVSFSLRGLASLRRDLPELAPMPVESRVLDEPEHE